MIVAAAYVSRWHIPALHRNVAQAKESTTALGHKSNEGLDVQAPVSGVQNAALLERPPVRDWSADPTHAASRGLTLLRLLVHASRCVHARKLVVRKLENTLLLEAGGTQPLMLPTCYASRSGHVRLN